MLKNSVIRLLEILSKSELKKFGKFLNCSYFNTNTKVIELYKILREYYPEFEALDLSKENIFRRLYKNEEVVSGTFYYLFSELEGLLEKFISYEKLDPAMLDLALLQEFSNQRLDSLYARKHKEAKQKFNKLHDPSNLNNFMLAKINLSYLAGRKKY